MKQSSEGDRVRIDIPDETDIDHQYHGQHGEIITTLTDNAQALTGDPVDNTLYTVDLEDGPQRDFRPRDLRPPIDNSINNS